MQERHPALPAGLRGPQAAPREGPPHEDRPRARVDVLLLKPEDLTGAAACLTPEPEHRGEVRADHPLGRLEDGPELAGLERVHVLAVGAREPAEVSRGVRGKQPERHGAPEDQAKGDQADAQALGDNALPSNRAEPPGDRLATMKSSMVRGVMLSTRIGPKYGSRWCAVNEA